MHLCIDVSTVMMGHYQLPRARYAVHLVSLKQKEKKHWRNFTLKSGGDQWRHQDLVSGARRSRRQRVMYVEGCSLPSRPVSLKHDGTDGPVKSVNTDGTAIERADGTANTGANYQIITY